jgi:hypothetical protein
MILPVSEGGGAAGHCPTLGPKVGFAGPPYKSAQPYGSWSVLREVVSPMGSEPERGQIRRGEHGRARG